MVGKKNLDFNTNSLCMSYDYFYTVNYYAQ